MSLSEPTIHVLVVDDHQLVRKSLLAMLAREPDIQVVSTAENGREAVERAQDTSPDVIIMDISLPKLDGIRAAGEIKALGISAEIVVLSMHYNNTLVQQARKNGVSGYVVKQNASRDLVSAIRAAKEGALSL
jgi:DNA-binding NarL/FixJ family response regulator